jgi:RsiW-degrading membrane proteinase PrsW (M82 family)
MTGFLPFAIVLILAVAFYLVGSWRILRRLTRKRPLRLLVVGAVVVGLVAGLAAILTIAFFYGSATCLLHRPSNN